MFQVYNEALILNEDCRTIDALNYMDSKFSEIYENQARCTTDMDRKLRENYESKLLYYHFMKIILASIEYWNLSYKLEYFFQCSVYTQP